MREKLTLTGLAGTRALARCQQAVLCVPGVLRGFPAQWLGINRKDAEDAEEKRECERATHAV
jgi:hypothetical protein